MKTPPRTLLVAALLMSACATRIQHGLEERDANELLSALVQRGFRAHKVPEKGKKPTWAIEVDDSEERHAMRVLTDLRLPRLARPTTRSIIQNVALIESPGVERLRHLEAQEGDIEESLESMDGVAGAWVELAVPSAPRPGQAAIPSKASVLLRARPDAVERLTLRRDDLRALVAGSVEGLQPNEVVLVVEPVATVGAPAMSGRALPAERLRPLVVGLGAALTVVAVLLVGLSLRLIQARRASAPSLPAGPEKDSVMECSPSRDTQRSLTSPSRRQEALL